MTASNSLDIHDNLPQSTLQRLTSHPARQTDTAKSIPVVEMQCFASTRLGNLQPVHRCRPCKPCCRSYGKTRGHLTGQMIGTGLEQMSDIKLCWQAAVLAVANLHPIQPAVEGRADALKLQRDPAKQQPLLHQLNLPSSSTCIATHRALLMQM